MWPISLALFYRSVVSFQVKMSCLGPLSKSRNSATSECSPENETSPDRNSTHLTVVSEYAAAEVVTAKRCAATRKPSKIGCSYKKKNKKSSHQATHHTLPQNPYMSPIPARHPGEQCLISTSRTSSVECLGSGMIYTPFREEGLEERGQIVMF